MLKNQRPFYLSPDRDLRFFFNRSTEIVEDQLWSEIRNGSIFGILKCDIKSPEAVTELFMKMNFAVIFKHMEVDEDLLSEEIPLT